MKDIPKHWVIKTLGEVCDIQTGKYDANHAKPNGKYRFYTCAFESVYCDTNRFNGESLILPGNGANVGEVFYYNGEFDAYQRTYVLNKIKTVPKYLYYHLLGNWKRRNQDKQFGSATNYIRMANFTDYEVPLPPLSEQQAIVAKIEELLSELDNGKQQLVTAQQQLKVYRQSLLKWAFEGKLTNKKVKDGELPKGWKTVKLGELIDNINSGKSYRCNERPPNDDEVGIIKVSSVTWGHFDEMESKTCFSNDLFNEKYQIKEGDFLFSRANTLDFIGACVIVNSIGKKLMLSDKILRFSFSKAILKEFALHYLRSKKGRTQIEFLSTGNQDSMRNIGQEKIKQIEIPLPTLKEQQHIVEELESKLTVCDKIEETISQSLQQAETLRESILKKAFEGRLV